ncbi:hypothetical protein LIER_39615 [Lithospermum erythrorhizon]|uniref:Uncharacterized protein n=1 Tax=Lithospermum erythrorhizon TaxID=34254 RepID=A0AAV3QHI9_LITER
MKFFLFFLIVILLFQSFTEAISSVTSDEEAAAVRSLNHQVEETRDQDSSLVKTIQSKKKINCKYACAKRCKLSSRKKVCIRACGTCCTKCNCVPPGTYGNHNACSCYARLKTHGNRLKCP